MIRAEIDCAEIRDRRDLHEKLKTGLRLPDYYGMNLDALYDCLTEPGEELVLALRNHDMLEERLEGYCGAFLRLLEEVERESARFRLELVPSR